MRFGDNYFINDYYIRSMLPYYLEKHKVNYSSVCSKKDLKKMKFRESLSYEKLFNLLNLLLVEINKTQSLTKSQLDHLIWYSYKGYSRY